MLNPVLICDGLGIFVIYDVVCIAFPLLFRW